MRGIVALLFVGAAACHGDQTSLREDVCTVITRCLATLPGEQAQLEERCNSGSAVLPPTLPEGCADCVFENESSCGSLIGKCESECSPPPTGGEDDQP
jgi:hypothetical protein